MTADAHRTTDLDNFGAHRSTAAVADAHGLLRVGRRDPLPLYVSKLWRRRSFAWQLSRARVGARNQEDALGSLWTILRPLLLVGVYFLVFGLILGARKGMEPYISMLACGVLMFQYTNQSITNGAKAVTGNMPLVRAIRFPRAVLPLSTVLTESIQAIPLYGVMVATCVLQIHRLSWEVFLLVPIFVLQTMFNVGGAMVVARLTSRVNDVAQIVPFFVRLWMYLSGVFFTIGTFHDQQYARWLTVNPLFDFISMARGAVVYSAEPVIRTTVDGALTPVHRVPFEWQYWGPGLAWAVVALVAGFIFFYRAEETYVEG